MTATPPVVDRKAWQEQMDALRVRRRRTPAEVGVRPNRVTSAIRMLHAI